MQLIARKDSIAQAHEMVLVDQIEPLHEEESNKVPKEKESSWLDIILDPDQVLPQSMKKLFHETNKKFKEVFNSELPNA